MRPPTIYDVAKAAGVASSTVSRTFSRPGRVNAVTAERVRRAAAALGYRSRSLAGVAPVGPSLVVGVMVSDISNPFYNEILLGAQAAAVEAGFTVLIADAQESGARERQALERTLPGLAGIVLATTRMPDSAIRVVAKQRPVVVLNRAVADVPSVITDNRHGIRQAVEHLAGLGHRRVTYAAGPEASWADGIRWRSLREAAAELGVHAQRIGPFPPTVAGGAGAAAVLNKQGAAAVPNKRGAAAVLNKRGAAAVVAYNDLMAIGIIRALAGAGVRLPDEVSVVGFDNIFAADLVTPGLTTVAAPLRAMGSTAVQHLLAIVRGARSPVLEPVSLPCRLVVRSSTAAATNGNR